MICKVKYIYFFGPQLHSLLLVSFLNALIIAKIIKEIPEGSQLTDNGHQIVIFSVCEDEVS